MPNAPISFTVTCSNNSSIKKRWKRFPFSVLSSVLAFLSRPVSHINNSSKTLFITFQPFGTEKHTSLQLALNLLHKRKSDKTHLLKRVFLYRDKDQTKNFCPFLYKRPFDHRKELLKGSQFYFKGFHFKSTSSGSFNKVWWKSRNHTEIRNHSEAYLEPTEGSMTELFCVNS